MPKWPLSSRAPSSSPPRTDARPGAVARLLIAVIAVYRLLLAPLLPPSCRYTPTCSVYASQALERHGAIRGAALAIRRVVRCHPWHAAGHDPVPEREV